MPESLEDIIADARERRKKADAADAAQVLEEEGILRDKKTEKPSAFETAAVNVTSAMHNPPNPGVAEEHSMYPKNVLSAAYELHLIHKAAMQEQKVFKANHTLDPLTEKENEIFIAIMREGVEHLDRELPALEGRARDDGVKDLASLVSGEQARLMAQNPSLFPETDSGAFGRISRMFRFKK